jgi:hypothetical protein
MNENAIKINSSNFREIGGGALLTSVHKGRHFTCITIKGPDAVTQTFPI